jgi:hypothetical protein
MGRILHDRVNGRNIGVQIRPAFLPGLGKIGCNGARRPEKAQHEDHPSFHDRSFQA